MHSSLVAKGNPVFDWALILASVFLVLRRQLAQQLLQFLLWCYLLALGIFMLELYHLL